MTVGDPRKAFLLSVIAFLALGFCGWRLLPKAETVVTQMLDNSGVHAPVPSNEGEYPMTLLNDPFSHPGFKTQPVSQTTGAAVQAGGVSVSSPPPMAGTNYPGPYTFGSGDVLPKTDPDENTGKGQQQEVSPLKVVRLEAIIQVDQPMAYIRYFETVPQPKSESGQAPPAGSQEQVRGFKVGDKLFGAKIISITKSEVTLQTKAKKVKLSVGGEQSL